MNIDLLVLQTDFLVKESRRVLVVDDDRDFAEGMAAVLELSGYSNRVAFDVEQALEMAREFSPNVALIDVRLDSTTNGLDLIPRLKEICPHILCVMITAFSEVDTAIEAVRKGAYDYLKKPLQNESIHAVLSRCFEKLQMEEEKRLAEEELARFAMVVRQVGEGVFITDSEGYIQFVNPAFEKLTGFSQEEAKGKKPNILKSGHQEDSFYEDLWGTIMGGEVWRGRIQNKRKDGAEFETEQTISPVFGGSGRIVNFVSIMRDVTYEVDLEKRLRQSQKMEAIGTLAAGIAHDFNNILTPLFNYTELLLSDSPEGSDAQKILQQMRVSEIRARNLVSQILFFSRRSDKKLKRFEPHVVVKEALDLLRASLPSTIEFVEEIDAHSGFIFADPTEIHQVVINLFTNAAQAMAESGGVLRVFLNPFEGDVKFAELRPNLKPGPYIKLTLSDTGPGIPPDIAERIFEPFYTTKEVGEGTGLGLAVVHGVVTNLGGAIEIETSGDKGTSFHLYLPRSDSAVAEEEGGEAADTRGREHILYVDDEEMIVETVELVLVRQGYTVTLAKSAQEALEIFRAEPDKFDLIITDLTMPKMTGDVLAAELIGIRADIPIILCSGFTKEVNPEDYMGLGIRSILMKPYSSQEIGKAIRSVLDEN